MITKLVTTRTKTSIWISLFSVQPSFHYGCHHHHYHYHHLKQYPTFIKLLLFANCCLKHFTFIYCTHQPMMQGTVTPGGEQTLREAKQCAQDQMTSNGRNKIQIRVCPLDSFFQLLFPKVVSIKHKSEKMLPETKSKWSKWLDYQPFSQNYIENEVIKVNEKSCKKQKKKTLLISILQKQDFPQILVISSDGTPINKTNSGSRSIHQVGGWQTLACIKVIWKALTQASDLVGLWQTPRICISDEFLDDADVLGPGTTL